MTLPPLPDLREALSALLKYAEINECQHDETHRGGVIWTICDGCGRKWADDRNPFKGYQEPAAITNARAAIAAHVPEAGCGNIAAVPAQPVATSARGLLAAWQAAANVLFVSRSSGQYTTDTVSRDDLIQLIEAAFTAAPQAVPVPANMALVPLEPTPEMVAAYLAANHTYWKEMDEGPAPLNKWRNGTPAEATAESYRAMLAAAPKEQPHE